MKKSKYYIFLISILHFISTLYLDRFVFVNETYYYSSKYIVLKFIVFLILIVFWSLIFYLIKKLREKDKFWMKAVKMFLIYFGLMMIILLLVWPGAWVWDEYFILESAQKLELVYWQNYLTSVFYIVCLMIIPFPAGIIIIQLLIISLIVTYLIVNINLTEKKKYLLFIPFFLPPVIFQNLYPLRLTLYAYFLLFTGAYIIFNCKKQFKIKDMFIVSFLTTILAVWRSEGIMYLLLIPVVVLIAYYKKINLKQCCIFIVLVFSFFVFLYYPQYKGTEDEYKYKLTAILNPLSVMLQSNLDGYDKIADELSKAINIDVLKENPSYIEIPAFWLHQQELLGDSFGKEQYDVVKEKYLYLIMKNPQTFLDARLKTFLATSGLGESNYISHSGYNLLTDSRDQVKKFIDNNILTKPFNNDVRQFVLNKIECRESQNINKISWQYIIFWNLVVTFVFLPFYAIINVFRKKWAMFLMICGLLLNAFLVFLTAPGVYFMYYFPMYLSANFLIIYEILRLLQNFKAKRDEAIE